MNTETTTETNRREGTLRNRTAALVLSLALIVTAGCGGGGGNSPTGVDTASQTASGTATASNSYTVTGDGFGLQKATYLSASKSDIGIVFRAAIATSITDPNYKTVTRIDIDPGAAVVPQVTYALGNTGASPAFAGNIYFLNGASSSLIRTVGGTITFTRYGGNVGDRVSGTYSAVIEDDNDPAKPTYTVSAAFDFVTGSYGPVTATN